MINHTSIWEFFFPEKYFIDSNCVKLKPLYKCYIKVDHILEGGCFILPQIWQNCRFQDKWKTTLAFFFKKITKQLGYWLLTLVLFLLVSLNSYIIKSVTDCSLAMLLLAMLLM